MKCGCKEREDENTSTNRERYRRRHCSENGQGNCNGNGSENGHGNGSCNGNDTRRRARTFYRINYDVGMTDDPRGLTPDDIYRYYNFTNRENRTGRGKTIALIDAYYYPSAREDLEVFSSTFNLPEADLRVVFPQGRPETNGGWIAESALDTQWAHAMAPDARLMLVSVRDNRPANLLAGVRYAVEHGADVVSMSWGMSEFADEADFDSYFSNRNVAFIASAGDRDAVTIYPSVSPYVLSVGGTELNINEDGELISETAWDESGGGPSRYISIPSWQRTFGISSLSNGFRATPDVAFDASPYSGVSVYVTNPTTGVGRWAIIGGTSLGAPSWAGIVASLGLDNRNLSRRLYDLAGRTSYTNLCDCFYDITEGTSGPYSARVGYDFITGLGAPNIDKLAENS